MLRLINDERTLRSVKKASACDPNAHDGGCEVLDAAVCQGYAYDEYCYKDYEACRKGAHDVCGGVEDVSGCSGAGEYDA